MVGKLSSGILSLFPTDAEECCYVLFIKNPLVHPAPFLAFFFFFFGHHKEHSFNLQNLGQLYLNDF
jgi:hypothetical protein